MAKILAQNEETLRDRNYVLSPGKDDYWCDFRRPRLQKLEERFGDKFFIIIRGHSDPGGDYFVVPYEKIKYALAKEAFYSKYNKWVVTISDKELNIHRSSEKIDLSKYYANRTLLEQASGKVRNEDHRPTKMSVMKFGGGGEQEAHRRMKEYIAHNPSLIGLPASARQKKEYEFWSGIGPTSDRGDKAKWIT
jgi:hypothetical protein